MLIENNYVDVNGALAQVLNWFTVNNLVLNARKTKCIKFALPNVKKLGCSLMLDNEALSLVESTVFLGITLDSKLQWGTQISCLAGKLSSAAYAVRKIRQITDVDTARLVYFSYFHSVMTYGILLWGKAADIETIFILQKRAVRAIYSLSSRASLREKFKQIDILTVASQYIYANIIFVHQNISLYVKKSDIHSINTRNKDKLVTSAYRLQKVQGSFLGLSARIYNKIPAEILNLPLQKFKERIKTVLVQKAFYNTNDYFNDDNAWV